MFDTAEVADIETIVATDVEDAVAGLSATPGQRLFGLSEPTVETATDEELTGLAGLVAGQHKQRFPEWYAGVLVVLSAAFAAALGIDPSGFHSMWLPALLVLSLVIVPVVGFAVLRRKTFAADRTAVELVGQSSVRAAICLVGTNPLPDWVPDRLHPKPSAAERLRRL
ncbi:hypothetical protein U3A55_01995 [Salarchaeum sp. III]|uniref:hypothetical protein n=1 Tax=Salarchaeum sp. III TaxID=3107927 RepID=UPI002EDA2EB7